MLGVPSPMRGICEEEREMGSGKRVADKDSKSQVCEEVLCGRNSKASGKGRHQGGKGGIRHRGGVAWVGKAARHRWRGGGENKKTIEWAKTNTEGRAE